MSTPSVFVSHSSADDRFVKELRVFLERLRIPVWVDSRNLRGGQKLLPAIRKAIEESRAVICVLSRNVLSSRWVRDEMEMAQVVAGRRISDGFTIIPILLPGIELADVKEWLAEELLAIRVELGPGGLTNAGPQLAAALSVELPNDFEAPTEVMTAPQSDLRLKFTIPVLEQAECQQQASATAVAFFESADGINSCTKSEPFAFTAPIGLVERDNLCWYLEEYSRWPEGVFLERAKRIEGLLPDWGNRLYDAIRRNETVCNAFNEWRQSTERCERRFSIEVDSKLPNGASKNEQDAATEAGCQLYALPWELLHDGLGYLFQGGKPVRVRRLLPGPDQRQRAQTELPIRVLLASPRPENHDVDYIDHRVCALPLVAALEQLGDLVELTILTPPTFPALREIVDKAFAAGQPFHVIHFDGHGMYNRQESFGALCFEDLQDSSLLHNRRPQLVSAADLASVVRNNHIPLVFLEACQSAAAEQNVTSSVAGKLLEGGAFSVVAMSHSVMVETARRFVGAFYDQLVQGATVGQAMLVAQTELSTDRFRGQIRGAGKLHLDDWFVPVLYQRGCDPQLFRRLPPESARRLMNTLRRESLGAMPETPAHAFIGRSRELLALERLMVRDQCAVICGVGGEGKTTLAIEFARWSVRTGRSKRAAFIPVDRITNTRAIVDSLGKQLLPEGNGWSVSEFKDLHEALLPIQRALRDDPTILVFDNLESILPALADHTTDRSSDTQVASNLDLIQLISRLAAQAESVRIVLTSRSALPTPFDKPSNIIALGALSFNSAVELVAKVIDDKRLLLKVDQNDDLHLAMRHLIELVGGHARALVLLAPDLARLGIRATSLDVLRLMQEMHQRHPGDRENSLIASVMLSLTRLPPRIRSSIAPLTVLHGGGSLGVISKVLGLSIEDCSVLADQLVTAGLAEHLSFGYVRIDPALSATLTSELNANDRARAIAAWSEVVAEMITSLHHWKHTNPVLSQNRTLLELPNIRAFVQHLARTGDPKHVATIAVYVEDLLRNLDQPTASAEARAALDKVRDKQLPGRALFLTKRALVDRLLEAGQDYVLAVNTAKQLLRTLKENGEHSYDGAKYDIVMAQALVGRCLRFFGDVNASLIELGEAAKLLREMDNGSDPSIGQNLAVILSDASASLRQLGQFSEAEKMLLEAMRIAEKIKDHRQVAVIHSERGWTFALQHKYEAALSSFLDARKIFGTLSERNGVSSQMIGTCYQQMGNYEAAERSYKEALEIAVQTKDDPLEMKTRASLGLLYLMQGQPIEAASLFKASAETARKCGDRLTEGVVRTSLGATLFRIGRFREARDELDTALRCKEPFGVAAAERWKTYNALCELERAEGKMEAMALARQMAMEAYLEYRHQGGENQTFGGSLLSNVYDAIRNDTCDSTEIRLREVLGTPNLPTPLKALVHVLLRILAGSRDSAFLADLELLGQDAAELTILLHKLKRP